MSWYKNYDTQSYFNVRSYPSGGTENIDPFVFSYLIAFAHTGRSGDWLDGQIIYWVNVHLTLCRRYDDNSVDLVSEWVCDNVAR